jgi:hypothetical protein
MCAGEEGGRIAVDSRCLAENNLIKARRKDRVAEESFEDVLTRPKRSRVCQDSREASPLDAIRPSGAG